jgi:hypothetical protein
MKLTNFDGTYWEDVDGNPLTGDELIEELKDKAEYAEDAGWIYCEELIDEYICMLPDLGYKEIDYKTYEELSD